MKRGREREREGMMSTGGKRRWSKEGGWEQGRRKRKGKREEGEKGRKGRVGVRGGGYISTPGLKIPITATSHLGGHVHTGGFQCVSSSLFWLCRQLSEHCRDTAGVAHEQRVTVGTSLTHLRVRVRLEGCVHMLHY